MNKSILYLSISFIIILMSSCVKSIPPQDFDEIFRVRRGISLTYKDAATNQNAVTDTGRYYPDSVEMHMYEDDLHISTIKPLYDAKAGYLLSCDVIDVSVMHISDIEAIKFTYELRVRLNSAQTDTITVVRDSDSTINYFHRGANIGQQQLFVADTNEYNYKLTILK